MLERWEFHISLRFRHLCHLMSWKRVFTHPRMKGRDPSTDTRVRTAGLHPALHRNGKLSGRKTQKIHSWENKRQFLGLPKEEFYRFL